jgi:hypothetical protein
VRIGSDESATLAARTPTRFGNADMTMNSDNAMKVINTFLSFSNVESSLEESKFVTVCSQILRICGDLLLNEILHSRGIYAGVVGACVPARHSR